MSLKDISQARKRFEDKDEKVLPAVVVSDGNGGPLIMPMTAFGELMTADQSPVVQMKFTSGIVDGIAETDISNSGTVTMTGSNLVTIGSGATTGSTARLRSKKIVRYSTGQGIDIRFTSVFSTGVAGTKQLIGFGSAEDAFAFGYNGTSFGICRRYAGKVETQKLTVTAAASGSGNLTITLNGGSGVTVAVTAGDTIGEVTKKIAQADYSGEDGGWTTLYGGDHVHFLAVDAEARTGAYSIAVAATGVTGSFSQEQAGVAPTEEWVAQADWNLDPCDGTRAIPILDPTKGNVYRISMQWLGFGAIEYYIEQPDSGKFISVHRHEHANTNTTTTVLQPDQPLFVEADNGATTSDIVVKTASMAAMNAGVQSLAGAVRNVATASVSVDTTEIPVMSIHAMALNLNGLTNRTRILVESVTFGNNGGKTTEFKMILNPTLVGSPSWASISSSTVVEIDTATTSVTGGRVLYSTIVGAGTAATRNLSVSRDSAIILSPGDILTFTAQLSSGAAAPMSVGVSFLDDI